MPRFDELFKEFGVQDEKSLTELLESDNICLLECVDCGKEFDIDVLFFIDGDPYCKECLGMEEE